MTAHESLNRVRNRAYEYERLLDKIAHLEALSVRVTPILSGTPKGSSRHGQTDEPWAALADYKKRCEEQLVQYARDCQELEAELGCIRSARVRTAMKYRYIDLYTIAHIADVMSMNERSVYKLLRRGRLIYEKKYEEGFEE